MTALKPILRKVHAFAGLGLALFFIAAGFSGAALVYRDEMLTLAHDEARPGAAGDVNAVAEQIVAAYGAGSITALKTPRPGFDAYELYLKDGRHLLVGRDGAAFGDVTPFRSITGTLADLHIHLFAGRTGENVNGIIGVLLALFVLTGLVVWPLRGFSWRSLAPRRPAPPDIHAFHRNFGVFAAALIVFSAATGAGVVFTGPMTAFLNNAAGYAPPGPPPPPTMPSDASVIPVSAAMEAAQRAIPGARVAMVLPANAAKGAYAFRLKTFEEIHPNGRSVVSVSSVDGTVMFRHDARNGAWSAKLMESLYPLHTGKTGWLAHKLFTLATGVALLLLACAGIASYVARRVASVGPRSDVRTPAQTPRGEAEAF